MFGEIDQTDLKVLNRNMPVACCCHQFKDWWLHSFCSAGAKCKPIWPVPSCKSSVAVVYTREVNCMAGQRMELKYIELKTGYHDDGPAWIGKVMLSKSGRMVYFNDHGFQRCIGISGNYYDVETGEEYWISSVKKSGQDRHWAGKGKICVALNALEDYLSITNSKTLDLKRFFTADISEIYPIERINELMNSSFDGEISE